MLISNKSIKLPGGLRPVVPRASTIFEILCGLRLTQTCLRAKHEEKAALNEKNENQ